MTRRYPWKEEMSYTCHLVTRIAAHGFAFFTGGFIQCQHMWCPRNKVSLFVACKATQSCLEPALLICHRFDPTHYWVQCLIYKLLPFSIFPSPDQELNPSVLPAAHNTGGSLPDLTNIQFPPPLSTPLDPDDTVAFPLLSSSNSTGSLTTNLTHLGISAASHGNVCRVFPPFAV